jgi:hypothetical protein
MEEESPMKRITRMALLAAVVASPASARAGNGNVQIHFEIQNGPVYLVGTQGYYIAGPASCPTLGVNLYWAAGWTFIPFVGLVWMPTNVSSTVIYPDHKISGSCQIGGCINVSNSICIYDSVVSMPAGMLQAAFMLSCPTGTYPQPFQAGPVQTLPSGGSIDAGARSVLTSAALPVWTTWNQQCGVIPPPVQ